MVHEPSGDVAAEVLTDVPVSYSEETSTEYDTVSIVGVELGIPVQETS